MNSKLLLSMGMLLAGFVLTAVAEPPFNSDQRVGGQAKQILLSRRQSNEIASKTKSRSPLAHAKGSLRVDNHVKRWVTFDVPEAGPYGTYPSAINDLGEVTGNYNDATAQQLQHGFLRSADGAIVSFDPPGSQLTTPESINNEGTIVGTYNDAVGNQHGFVRSRDGKFTTLDEPNAGGFPLFTQVNSINDLGAITGWYFDANGDALGFLREPNGAFTDIVAPGTYTGVALGTTCGSINIEGEVGCQYSDTAGTWHALLRYVGGALVIVDAPGAGLGGGDLGTFIGFPPQAVNALGQATGEFADPENGYHGYLRSANGSFVEFTVPGSGTNQANGTYPAGVNIWGTVSGFSFDPNGFPSGFVRFADGVIQGFQAAAPNDQGTIVWGINTWGVFTGYSYDANGTAHGFVAVAVP